MPHTIEILFWAKILHFFFKFVLVKINYVINKILKIVNFEFKFLLELQSMDK